MSDDLVKRLTIKAGCIDMGEKIAWGSDTALMREAAERIEELEAKLAKAVEALFEALYLLDPDEEDIAKETGLYRILTTFNELKGDSHE